MRSITLLCLTEEQGGRIKCTRGKLPRFLEMRDGGEEGGLGHSLVIIK